MAFRKGGLFEVLKIRDYRLLWISHLISAIGDWILLTALLVFVYRLTKNESTISMMMVAEIMPVILLGYFAGPIVDCYNRRSVMIVSDLIRAFAVMLLLFVNSPSHVWIVYLIAFLIGMGGLFFRPARNASIPKIVPSKLLISANSLSSMNETLGMIVGSAIGGMLSMHYIKLAGALDAVTFLLSALLIRIAVVPQELDKNRLMSLSDFRKEAASGIHFLAKNYTVKFMFAALCAGSIGVGVCNVTEIVFATNILHLSGSQFGFLLSSMAVGIIIGSVALCQLGKVLQPMKTFSYGMLCFGIFLTIFSMTRSFFPAAIALGLTGLGSVCVTISSATIFQIVTPNKLQGRITSLVWIIYTMLMGLAMLAAAPASKRLGVHNVLLLSGLMITFSGVFSVVLLCMAKKSKYIGESEESSDNCPAALWKLPNLDNG